VCTLVKIITIDELRARVAANARDLMEADERTGAELAEVAGVSERQLRRIKRGEKLGLDTLLPLATALGLDVSALVAPRA
jgi:transcriptional regulator with XRE-family HTH domain